LSRPKRQSERLGGGGFGEVWSAKSAVAEFADVAIIVVRSEHLRGDGADAFPQLITEEIGHHRKLAHADIVKLLAAGSVALPGCATPTPYLVMELWNGLPLPDACRGHSVKEKIRCLVRICESVQYAHRQGLMHLDLKPENILVKDEGGKLRPKLLDFGISRRFRADRPFDRRPHPVWRRHPGL
jgi:serine/threonine protein kinase